MRAQFCSTNRNPIPAYAQPRTEPMFVSNEDHLIPNPDFAQTDGPLPVAQPAVKRSVVINGIKVRRYDWQDEEDYTDATEPVDAHADRMPSI